MNKKDKIKVFNILQRYKWLIDDAWKDNLYKEQEFDEIDKLTIRLHRELHK